ncbi:hypothetical protein HQN64_19610 [Enterobacteriaceae bacterium BIT-l23]|uniref:hypothetical protein n=1 Tax=Jejubacter sp. L23 TaxID=3092086 RepID=UPI001585CD92|nr:hypothetical protein [Enterobacteriaceae bacterium BIT-l23]
MMTEPKLTGRKSGFLFGIRTGEQNKTYTLSVEAASTADATDKLTQAIHTIKNNELVIYHGYGAADGNFRFYTQNTSHENSSCNRTNSSTEMRKNMVSQLANLMSSEEQTWRLPDAVHAVVAALFVLYDQDLVTMELRKTPSFNTGLSGK